MQPATPLAVSLLCLVLGSKDELTAAGTLLDMDTIYSPMAFDGRNNISISVIEDDAGDPSGRSLGRSIDTHTFHLMHDRYGSCSDYWYKSTVSATRLHKNSNTLSPYAIPQMAYYNYPKVVENVQGYWSRWLADIYINHHNIGKINIEKTTLIGHGMAAHLMGIAAKKIFKKTGMKVERIIAGSPLGPFFHPPVEEDKRIHKDDAKCVIVIHTDQMFLGYKLPIGGMDFYVNGGLSQPGCSTLPCSSYRAGTLIHEGIKLASDTKKIADLKDSPDGRKRFLQALGGDCSAGNGIYNLTTNSKAPYLE